jgi:hypothetical protein
MFLFILFQNVSLIMNAQNDELKDASLDAVESTTNEERSTSRKDVSVENGSRGESNQIGEGGGSVSDDVISREGPLEANDSSDHALQHSKSEFEDTTQPLDQTSNIPVHFEGYD